MTELSVNDIATVTETETPKAPKAPKALILRTGKLNLPMPTVGKKSRAGAKAQFPLATLEVGECILFNPENMAQVRNSVAAAHQKFSENTGEVRDTGKKLLNIKRHTRKFTIAELSGDDVLAIPDEVLMPIFPNATERPTKVAGCWRVQ
jgi:hypothetical protein